MPGSSLSSLLSKIKPLPGEGPLIYFRTTFGESQRYRAIPTLIMPMMNATAAEKFLFGKKL